MEFLLCLEMTSDKPYNIPPVHVGELVWGFDVDSQMKVPLTVTKVYEDGTWDGKVAWTWGWA